MTSSTVPDLPFPIFQISQAVERYLLYDVKTITWLRKTYNILGVLIGTLPQIPQQNVFLGLPLELQPEEARLLVEKGLGYIVDDLQWHKDSQQSMTPAQREAYLAGLKKEGMNAARVVEQQKQQRTEQAMKRLHLKMGKASSDSPNSSDSPPSEEVAGDRSLFDPAPLGNTPSLSSSASIIPWTITPTTSYPPPPSPSNHPISRSPTVDPPSYTLFKHLHSLSYFLSPGLRFGCQFLVYPGDPLRFHSHFLATSAEWDEEIDLLDLVGGGRLGTGVKKGWLVGGVEDRKPRDEKSIMPEAKSQAGSRADSGSNEEPSADSEVESRVRTFCIEWGGM